MNIHHITFSPQVGVAHLHFWGCNLNCRACLLKKELYDCHLRETKDNIFNNKKGSPGFPEHFLELSEILDVLRKLEVRQVVFMGAEPTTDRQLPHLAAALHEEFSCHNVLLTNGFIFVKLEHIDELVFSVKAYTAELHYDYTGKPNKKALENFTRYYRTGVKMRAESIFIPEYIDGVEIEKISRFIASVDRSIPYRIDGYIPIGDNPWRHPTSREMEEVVNTARKYLDNVGCLTGNEELKFDMMRVV